MEVINGNFGKRPCEDLLQRVDEIRQAVIDGRITDFVCAYEIDGEYETVSGASLRDSLVLATLLKIRVEDNFRAR